MGILYPERCRKKNLCIKYTRKICSMACIKVPDPWQEVHCTIHVLEIQPYCSMLIKWSASVLHDGRQIDLELDSVAIVCGKAYGEMISLALRV